MIFNVYTQYKGHYSVTDETATPRVHRVLTTNCHETKQYVKVDVVCLL